MKDNIGYRCENCGRLTAKYEAQISQDNRKLLLCFACLNKWKDEIRKKSNK